MASFEITTAAREAFASPRRPAAESRPFYFALAALTAAFGVIRLTCARNDLWLDEIWSLRLLESVRSPLQILTIRHDNNHPLNSLALYVLMPAQADWLYRLFPLVTGTATVWMAGLVGRRQFRLLHFEARGGAAAGLVTAAFVGAAYIFILYSSEARGYAPMVFFALVAIYALLRGEGGATGIWIAVYGAACGLGLLSHATMAHVVAGGLAWSLAKARQERGSGWRQTRQVLAWQATPWACLAVYYFGFLRRIEIGGGPDIDLADVIGQLSQCTLGFSAGVGTTVAVLGLAVIVTIGVTLVFRRSFATGWLYVTMLVLAPAVALVASRFTLLFPRYFIVTALGALLLGGYAVARLWLRGGVARVAAIVAAGAFLVGNASDTVRLERYGRGEYRLALRWVAEHTPTAVVTVSSDQDDRNTCVMQYHGSAVGQGRSIRYFPQNDLPADGTQWLFLHRFDHEPAPSSELRIEHLRYELSRVFRHAPLSGWDWYVYRRTNPPLALPTSSGPVQ